MRWCIYYSDGSTYSYKDGPPQNAPVTGVQFVAQVNKANKWVALCNCDFILWDERDGIEQWYPADNSGRENYMRKEGWRKVLICEWIGDESYEKLSDRVSNDLQVARKTGYAWWEYRPDEE